MWLSNDLLAFITVFVYNITDADSHLDELQTYVASPAATKSDTLTYLTVIVSSDNSKQVVEKYNENLSGQKPAWLENDFQEASISSIQVEGCG